MESRICQGCASWPATTAATWTRATGSLDLPLGALTSCAETLRQYGLNSSGCGAWPLLPCSPWRRPRQWAICAGGRRYGGRRSSQSSLERPRSAYMSAAWAPNGMANVGGRPEPRRLPASGGAVSPPVQPEVPVPPPAWAEAKGGGLGQSLDEAQSILEHLAQRGQRPCRQGTRRRDGRRQAAADAARPTGNSQLDRGLDDRVEAQTPTLRRGLDRAGSSARAANLGYSPPAGYLYSLPRQ